MKPKKRLKPKPSSNWLNRKKRENDWKKNGLPQKKKQKNPKKDIGPHTLLYQDRCVLCTRCVRFGAEVVHESGHSASSPFAADDLSPLRRGDVVALDARRGLGEV